MYVNLKDKSGTLYRISNTELNFVSRQHSFFLFTWLHSGTLFKGATQDD